jgi:hypothetical protein
MDENTYQDAYSMTRAASNQEEQRLQSIACWLLLRLCGARFPDLFRFIRSQILSDPIHTSRGPEIEYLPHRSHVQSLTVGLVAEGVRLFFLPKTPPSDVKLQSRNPGSQQATLCLARIKACGAAKACWAAFGITSDLCDAVQVQTSWKSNNS